ncbi:MAG TPA: hypothetical protein VLN45_06910 [Ignavibacteriaceae bacterium]|nr:hypothetical protein [Ignavibacteriaceae bacterium]
MLETSTSDMKIPTDLKPIIEEIVAAHKEKRIKTIKFSNPTIWQILDEQEPETKKIYMQILPKEKAQ